MIKQKKLWDNTLTVIMALLCLLWIYPIVLTAEQPEKRGYLYHLYRVPAAHQ